MVLEKIHNRWRGVVEEFQLSASQSSTPPITDQLISKAYKATIDEWSVRCPSQPLCGPHLTLEVNRKLLTFLNNCPANTRIAIGKLLSNDEVHARAMENLLDAFSTGRYPSTDMLGKAIETIADKAPPSGGADVPRNALIEDIIVRLRLPREKEAELMATLIKPSQDSHSTHEGSVQGPTNGSSRGSNSSELPPSPSRGSISSQESFASLDLSPTPPRGSISSEGSFTSLDLPPPPPSWPTSSQGSFTSLDLPAPPARGSTTSSQYFSLSGGSITPHFIRNEDGDAAVPPTLGALTSITEPTKEWVNEEVAYIQNRVGLDLLDHRADTVRIKNGAEELELNGVAPFPEAIEALRKAFKDPSYPLQEHVKQVLNDAIYWHRKEAETFRNSIFNGKTPALEERINALSKLAAVPGNATDALREELNQIVKEVQRLPGIKPTRAAGNDDVARLQIAKIFRDRESLQDKAVDALLEKLRLQMMQQTTKP